MSDNEPWPPMTTLERIAQAIHSLPTLTEEEVSPEDSCAICLVRLTSIAKGEAQSNGTLEMCGQEVQLSGVTKLEGCGHVFCRVE